MTPENILVVTSKIDVTADLVVDELQRRGISVVRFNVEDFPTKSKIKISFNDKLEAELRIPTKGSLKPHLIPQSLDWGGS